MQIEFVSMEPCDERGVGRDGDYSDILGKPLCFCDVQLHSWPERLHVMHVFIISYGSDASEEPLGFPQVQFFHVHCDKVCQIKSMHR